MVTEICSKKYKKVKITLEFPEQANETAEQEFIGRLKEIYLEKIKKRSVRETDLTLTFNPTSDKEDMLDG